MKTPPVAILMFNRPDKIRRLLESLKAVRPEHLLIISDGPRPSKPDDAGKVDECRALVESIGWSCKIDKNFAPANMGCRRRVSSGIDWVFENVERAIFLEDDCLPDPSFFPYCDELLERYADVERVMSICGTNYSTRRLFPESYSFSRYVRVWGWASWRSAWKHYDVTMKHWSESQDKAALARSLFGDTPVARFWSGSFDRVAHQNFDTWDYQWSFAHLIRDGLSIIPAVNMISNIGFDMDATHTRRPNVYQALPLAPMDTPMIHPPTIIQNRWFDAVVEKRQLPSSLFVRVFNLIKAMMGIRNV